MIQLIVLVKLFKKMWKNSIFLEIYSRCHGLNFELNKWKYVHVFDMLKQLSDIDCGVYICTCATAVINMCPVSVKSCLLARYSIAHEVSSITANEKNFNNIDHPKDVVIRSTILQDVKITNDLPQLLYVEPENEPVTLETFYHKLCNLENGKSPSKIYYGRDDDFSELEDIGLNNNKIKSSNVDEVNQQEAELDLVKFKTFAGNNIKLKDWLKAKKMSTNIRIDKESSIH